MSQTLYSRRFIHSTKWEVIFTPLPNMYPRLVRGFYENMVLHAEGVRMFKTSIDDYQLEVTPRWINQYVGISLTAPPPPPVPAAHPDLAPISFRTPHGAEPDIPAMVESISENPGTFFMVHS